MFLKGVVICMMAFGMGCAAAVFDAAHFFDMREKAYRAETREACVAALNFCRSVLEWVPAQAEMHYLTARLHARMGNRRMAVKHLRMAAALGFTPAVPFNKIHWGNDAAFDAMRTEPEFRVLNQELKRYERPIQRSRVAFVLEEQGLEPEGIAYDDLLNCFYLGSGARKKIIKVSPQGVATDFTGGQDGLDTVLGLHVDPIRRWLWVCSQTEASTDVFRYDLVSGSLLKRYSLSRLEGNHSFNDLAIHPSGDVYITESIRDDIYLISHTRDRLELFFSREPFVSFNGVAVSDDGESLFVADALIGIYKVDLVSRDCVLLTHEPLFDSSNVDGLVFFRDHLYAVQPGLNTVCRFGLNKDRSRITGRSVFEQNSVRLNWPTTGVIAGNSFYFIADTQGDSNGGHAVVMKTDLD